MAQQLPDDPGAWIGTALGAIGTVATSVAAAYAVVRRTRSETSKEAAGVAQTTVQATLDAMKTVIEGLTGELTRRQTELDELRKDLEETRKELRRIERAKTDLELNVARLEEQIAAQSRVINHLKQRMDRSSPEMEGHDDVK